MYKPHDFSGLIRNRLANTLKLTQFFLAVAIEGKSFLFLLSRRKFWAFLCNRFLQFTELLSVFGFIIARSSGLTKYRGFTNPMQNQLPFCIQFIWYQIFLLLNVSTCYQTFGSGWLSEFLSIFHRQTVPAAQVVLEFVHQKFQLKNDDCHWGC